jgi:hypothetical protein
LNKIATDIDSLKAAAGGFGEGRGYKLGESLEAAAGGFGEGRGYKWLW